MYVISSSFLIEIFKELQKNVEIKPVSIMRNWKSQTIDLLFEDVLPCGKAMLIIEYDSEITKEFRGFSLINY